jgi:hypothetical protein
VWSWSARRWPTAWAEQRSAAAIYGVVGTAKLNGRDPKADLCEMLTRIADHPISRISELLPWTIISAVAEVST